MSGSKQFEKIAWLVTAFILLVTFLFMSGESLGLQAAEHVMGYEERLFDNSKVHTIDIVMDDWDELIENATSEEYYAATIVIDGESFKNVAIRGKGNTSLSNVASLDSERYSFKVEFDHYNDSSTYHGLDKLSLNNLIQDATMMKDYLTYTMMHEFDATTPLCSFVYITVNGEDWGLYLAVEGVEDSFLERNFGTDIGELYKPDSSGFGGGRGNGKNFNMEDFNIEDFNPENFDVENFDMENFDPSSLPDMMAGASEDTDETHGQGKEDGQSQEEDRANRGGIGGMGGMGSSDVKLSYTDDELSSYSNIWNNAKTDITTADKKRLIDSLEKLSNQEDIESVVDVESVIRYFVVHNYVCNGDSYTGSMVHNYYLYEDGGQLSMIPWDYNLAYGSFHGGDATSAVNTPIDSPVSGGSGEDRPMWYWIVSDETYTELYHQYFEEFLNTVDVQGLIEEAYERIKPYVEKDPTAFYSYEEFEKGVETLKEFCALRSESIAMQLENGETTEDMGYVDASDLNLSHMGTMNMGGGFGGGFGADFGGDSDGEAGSTGSTDHARPQGFGEMSEEELQSMQERFAQFAGGPGEASGEGRMPGRGDMNDQGAMPSFGNMPGMAQASSNKSDWIWVGASAILLGVGIAVAKLYKRN